MSNRTSESNKAIATAWENERELVLNGEGTRDWTPEQQKDIITKGRVYGDNGKALEGHHMKSAEKYPQYQGDAGNIQFLTKEEHLAAHQGNWQIPTNGYYNHETGQTNEFGNSPYEPCEVKKISEPIIVKERENEGADKKNDPNPIEKLKQFRQERGESIDSTNPAAKEHDNTLENEREGIREKINEQGYG